jgi:hypothetical protein
MIRLILSIIIMLYYWLFRIKSYGKLLIFSTVGGPAEECVQFGPYSSWDMGQTGIYLAGLAWVGHLNLLGLIWVDLLDMHVFSVMGRLHSTGLEMGR